MLFKSHQVFLTGTVLISDEVVTVFFLVVVTTFYVFLATCFEEILSRSRIKISIKGLKFNSSSMMGDKERGVVQWDFPVSCILMFVNYCDRLTSLSKADILS